MIGQSIATCEFTAFRWLQQFWGIADINIRQRWNIAWPHLSILPLTGVKLLDAGCGVGLWSLEIAARRPGWKITGIDRDADSLRVAERARSLLNLDNVSFESADLLQFQTKEAFDVVLSVESAHYLAQAGLGRELFQKYAQWLTSNGALMMLASRSQSEVPLWRGLPNPMLHSVFFGNQIEELCEAAGLTVERLQPELGSLATAAKQVSVAARGSIITRAIAYPIEVLLCLADSLPLVDKGKRSNSWCLIARMKQE